MKIVVGSKNPSKIAAVKKIAHVYFPESDVAGLEVSSHVSEQPMTDEETYLGAYNRANNVLKQMPDADLVVGIEAGFSKQQYGWLERALVIIINREKEQGIGASSGLVFPDSVMKEILSGKTLEEVIDRRYKTTHIGEGIGAFGLLTNEVVLRANAMEQGIAFAFVRFIHPELWDQAA